MKIRAFRYRLGYALAGLVEVWRREKSFPIQLVLAGLATLLVLVLQPGFWWKGLVPIANSLVSAFELINSAIEYLVDHLHPEVASEIKFAKDLAAVAVLVVSVGALAFGGLMVFAMLTW